MNKPPSRRKKDTSIAFGESVLPDDQDPEDISQEENPATATITVTAVEVPELTEEEQRLRLESECQQMQVICDRINRLRNHENLEDAPSAVLKYLGELKRPDLTAVSEKMLSLIELEYEVD